MLLNISDLTSIVNHLPTLCIAKIFNIEFHEFNYIWWKPGARLSLGLSGTVSNTERPHKKEGNG